VRDSYVSFEYTYVSFNSKEAYDFRLRSFLNQFRTSSTAGAWFICLFWIYIRLFQFKRGLRLSTALLSESVPHLLHSNWRRCGTCNSHVSFHTHRSLSYVSFHIYWSLFIYIGLFQFKRGLRFSTGLRSESDPHLFHRWCEVVCVWERVCVSAVESHRLSLEESHRISFELSAFEGHGPLLKKFFDFLLNWRQLEVMGLSWRNSMTFFWIERSWKSWASLTAHYRWAGTASWDDS